MTDRPLSAEEQDTVDELRAEALDIEMPDDVVAFERHLADLVRRLGDVEAERDEAVSMGTQLERERDEERRLKEEALHCISSAVLALLKARQG